MFPERHADLFQRLSLLVSTANENLIDVPLVCRDAFRVGFHGLVFGSECQHCAEVPEIVDRNKGVIVELRKLWKWHHATRACRGTADEVDDDDGVVVGRRRSYLFRTRIEIVCLYSLVLTMLTVKEVQGNLGK